MNIREIIVDKNHDYENKAIKEINLQNQLIVMVQRNNKTIIPSGNTIIFKDDLLVIVNK